MPQPIASHWPQIRKLFNRSFNSCLHYSIATVNADGTPQVTPIGSLILLEGNKGVYFEEFPRQLPVNAASRQAVCVLAVDAGKWFWIRSLLTGRFKTPPGIRLYGVTGNRRIATDEELAAWRQRIAPFKWTKGYRLLWKNMRHVREIDFTGFEPIRLGKMTRSELPAYSSSN